MRNHQELKGKWITGLVAKPEIRSVYFESQDLELQKGAITEIHGHFSAGKTSFVQSILAEAVKRSECAAIVDVTDAFDPLTSANFGVNLSRLLWIRCNGNLEHALKVTDYILHLVGFGIILLDLGSVRPEIIGRIPLSYWFRFRLSVENTPTVFLVNSPVPCCGSGCASRLEFRTRQILWAGSKEHRLFEGLHFQSILTKHFKATIPNYGR
jgi:hypothetical protein